MVVQKPVLMRPRNNYVSASQARIEHVSPVCPFCHAFSYVIVP
jgi:hypothetical protein